MKPVKIIAIATLFLFAAIVHANAQPRLSIGAANVNAGNATSLDFLFTGDSNPYAGVNAKIIFPQGTTVTNVSKGALLPSDFVLSWRAIANGVAVIIYSGSSSFSANGTLLSLNLQTASSAASGNVNFAANDAASFIRSGHAVSNATGTVSQSHTTGYGFIAISSPTGDTDNDGLPDSWERTHFGDLSQNGAGDSDADGLTNLVEYMNNTDPENIDTDGDGMQDGWEARHNLNFLTNDANLDPDQDGLTNLREHELNSDPNDYTAGCAIDMDITTRNYQNTISTQDIENSIGVSANGTVWVALAAQNSKNLDTFQIEVHYDTARARFESGVEDNPMGGISNFLKKNGATTIGFQAVESSPGVVNVTNSITGSDYQHAPNGSGIIALLQFTALDAQQNNPLSLNNVRFINPSGEQKEITVLTHGSLNNHPPWNFNGDGIVDYRDLQVFADHWLFKDDLAGWDPTYNLSQETGSDNKHIIDYRDLQIFADHWLETMP